jgi:preprotein translocase subunit SecY
MVFVFRIGSLIPAPFIDASVLTSTVDANAGNYMGYIDILTGGAFSSATLFAMSITPYITSSIIVQLLTVAIPALEAWAKEGMDGRKKLNKLTRYVTLGLSLIQSTAYFILNRNLGSVRYTQGFEGYFAAAVIISCFVAGSMLIVWLGEQIDKNGIGNGISIMLFAGIVSRAPSALLLLWNYLKIANAGDTKYYLFVPLVIVVFVVLIVSIIHMTNAERRIPVQYAKRVVGRKMYGGQSSFIPVKVMMSGVMPIIFASSLLAIPSMIKSFITADPNDDRWIVKFLGLFDYQTMTYAVMFFLLIIAFNYFYVAIQYNPMEMANNLRKNNGTVPGIRPGKPTSDFIAKVISRITLIGALFIAVVAILPIILGGVFGMNIALGGTSIIIVVGVALDTVRQLESQMMMRHYKGFLQ